MPISIKDTSGNLVAMTNAQKTQFLSDIGGAEFPTSSDDYYIVRRDVWDWTAV